MKPIKMFGLAALAALMAMAFVGASSAMAESTQLCKEDGEPCSTATTSVHEVSVGKAKLLASPEVQCNVLFESTSVGAGGSPQIVEGHFTYTNCGCTVKEKAGTTAKINVLKEGHETASVTGEAEIIVTCFGIECTYKDIGLKGTAKGPLLSTEANGEVNVSEQEVSGKGVFCPSKGKLDIKTTPLAATYIGYEAGAGEKMVCIWVNKNNGYYLGASGTQCTNGQKTRVGEYELGQAPTNSSNEMVCAWIGVPKENFYLARRWWPFSSECKDEHKTRIGEYELGVTQ